MSIRIGILGYGNLGRGVEKAVMANEDQELKAIYTRRDPAGLKTVSGCPVFSAKELEEKKEEIDVLILCGGSATDLPTQTRKYAALYNVVDSFDTHANIPQHFAEVDEAAGSAGKTGVISCGWDPGMFSLSRLYAHSVLPDGKDYTFWGRGVSQGHSDAIRRIEGVADARQYTVPVQEAIDQVRTGSNPELSVRQKHTRECFVVAKEGADLKAIERQIKEMPNYFADYDVTVTFISAQEMKEKHSELPHGGSVIYSGRTGEKNHVIEYSLKLDSNPEFTGSVIAAVARAAYRMNAEGITGAKTMFDIAPKYLSPQTDEWLRAHYL